jgi:hypothetical protein
MRVYTAKSEAVITIRLRTIYGDYVEFPIRKSLYPGFKRHWKAAWRGKNGRIDVHGEDGLMHRFDAHTIRREYLPTLQIL